PTSLGAWRTYRPHLFLSGVKFVSLRGLSQLRRKAQSLGRSRHHVIREKKMVKKPDHSDALYAARCVADHAVRAGLLSSRVSYRPVFDHMGAVLADSVLQAGLNYE